MEQLALEHAGGGILDDRLARYLDVLQPPPDALLLAMRNVADECGLWTISPDGGAVLSLLAGLHRPERVLEIGTGIGLTTLLVARELPSRSTVVTVEADPETHAQAHAFLERADFECAVEMRLGAAPAALSVAEDAADMLVVSSAAGPVAPELFSSLLDLMTPGGVVVVCDVLRGGAVAHAADVGTWTDPHIEAQRAFNRRFGLDERLARATIVPVGGGLAVATVR